MKIFISAAKYSDPMEFTRLHTTVLNEGHCVKVFTGGPWHDSFPDDCFVVVLIPPKITDNHVYLGKGQYEILTRALDREQQVLIYEKCEEDKYFYHLFTKENIIKRVLNQDWQQNYACISLLSRFSYTRHYHKTGTKKNNVDNSDPNSDFIIAAAHLLDRFK